MARGRMLNKSVSVSTKFAALPDDTTRLIASWTIAHLDKNGVFPADPAVVRALVCPMLEHITTTRVAECIAVMEAGGLIRTFTATGKRWMYWPGFRDNQVGLRGDRETTTYPNPPANPPESEQQKPDAGSLPEDSRKDAGDLPDKGNAKEKNLGAKAPGGEDVVAETRTPEDINSPKAVTVGSNEGVNTVERIDALENIFNHAVKAQQEPHRAAILAWNLPAHLERVCLDFQEVFGVKVMKADKGQWSKGAKVLHDLGVTRVVMAEAKRKNPNLTITWPGALQNLECVRTTECGSSGGQWVEENGVMVLYER